MADLPAPRRCRGDSCRAPIIFIPTQARRIPLDAAPNPNGNVLIDEDLLGEPLAVVLTAETARDDARAQGRDLYMPHHATCPDVEDFRHA